MNTNSRMVFLAALIFLSALQAGAADGTNTTTTTQTASWSTLTWTGGTPNGIGDTAAFRFSADQNITLDQSVTLGRLDATGTGQFNLLRSGTNTITFDNTSAGTVASILLTRAGGDATARDVNPNLILNSDTIVTWGRVQVRAHGIGGIISGVGRLSLNYAIAPTEGPDTATTINLNGAAGHTIYLGTAGDAASTYSGGTDLRAANSAFTVVRYFTRKVNALGTGRLYMNKAALDMQTYDQTVGGLSGGANTSKISSTSASGTTTLTLDFSSGSLSFSGVIMDGASTGVAGAARTIALAKNGAGTQALTGINTFTGGTTILGGTLTLGNTSGDTLANTGAVTVNGGTLDVAQNDTVGAVTLTTGTISGVGTLTGSSYAVSDGLISAILGGAGSLGKDTAGTVTLSGENAYSGGTTVSGGTLAIGAGGTTGSVSGDIVNNATLEFNRSNDLIFAGVISGSGDVTKKGAGRLTLTGDNSFNGAISILEGTVSLGRATSTLTGGVNINGGTLDVAYDDTVGAVTLTDGTISGAAALTGASYAVKKGAVNSVLAGSGALTKDTADTVTLSAAQTYDGGTEIKDGTLALSGSGALANGGAVHVNGSGARFDLGGGSDTVGAVTLTDGQINNGTLTGSGFTVKKGTVNADLAGGVGTSLIKQTAGTATLAGSNTYGGLTTVSAGTLIVSGTVANGAQVDAGTLQINSGATLSGGATVAGGKLVADGTVNGAVTVSGSGTLGGSGTLAGTTTIGAGGVLSPGNSPGQLTHADGLTLSNGSTYVWELVVNDNLGVAGTDYDQELITGGDLNVDAGATLSLVFNSSGSSVDWSNLFWADPHQWVMMDFSGTGTSSGNFGTVDVSLDSGGASLADSRPGYGFTSVRSGNSLVLNYDVIPEPATAGVLVLGLMGVALRRRALTAA